MVQLQLISSLGVIAICAIVCLCNSLTLVAIGRYRTLKTKCNLLVAHLALVDLITGLVTWPVLEFLASDDNGKTSCLAAHAIVISLKETSQLFLLLICIVMYVKIAYPLRYSIWLTTRRLHVASAMSWLLGITVGMLCFLWIPNSEQVLEHQMCFVTVIPFSYWIALVNWPFILISISILLMYYRIIRIARQHCRHSSINLANYQRSDSVTSCSTRRSITLMPNDQIAIAERVRILKSGKSDFEIRDVLHASETVTTKLESTTQLDMSPLVIQAESTKNSVTGGNKSSYQTDLTNVSSNQRNESVYQSNVNKECNSQKTYLDNEMNNQSVAKAELMSNTNGRSNVTDKTHVRHDNFVQSSQVTSVICNETTNRPESAINDNANCVTPVIFRLDSEIDEDATKTLIVEPKTLSQKKVVIKVALSERQSRQEMQIIVTMMVAFLAFVLCWLPLEVAIYLANWNFITDGNSLFVQIGLLVSLSNSGINVFIYSWRYATFRKALLSIFTCDRNHVRYAARYVSKQKTAKKSSICFFKAASKL